MASMSTQSYIGGPDPAIEIGFTLSAGSGGDGSATRQAVIYAEGNATGTGTDDDISDVLPTAAEAEAFFGAVSGGAYMAHLLFDTNQYANVRCVKVAVPSGTTAASNTIVFAGTASSTGEWTLDILGHLITVPVTSGDLHTEVSARFEAAWNALQGVDRPPVTASDSSGTVTMAANSYSTEYNDARLAKVTTGNEPGTMTCTVTGNLTGGDGTNSFTASLAAIASERTPLLVSMWSDSNGSSGSLDLLKDHVADKSNPQDQLWSAVVAAESNTTVSSISSDVDNYDDERVRVIGWVNSKHMPMAMAADYAGVISLTNNLALPRNGVVLPHMRVPETADILTKAERIAALNAGWCPGKPVDGSMTVTRYVMSRYDLGVVDANAIDVLDYIATRFSDAFSAIGPVNVVPDDVDIRGDDKMTLGGVQSIVENELVYVEEEDGFLYSVKANLDRIVTTYEGGGEVKVTIPADCLQVVPGLHNVIVEGNHAVDAA